ncbi:MAG: helix-turn-helix domain-containing protein [Prevotellaceae bacterium]|jgi:transcriptional regulator with XRE-family HTH domain|nr:helix-turn-helix domain-containing protein [Prevotellaceae bacterium]
MDWCGKSDSAIIAELGSRLKEVRLRKNFTQEELAKRSGIGTGSVHKVESGKVVSFAILVAVMRTLRLLDNFDTFIPKPYLSPVELLKSKGKARRRASKIK